MKLLRLRGLKQVLYCLSVKSLNPFAESHSSVSSVPDLRTEGRWFDPLLGQYSFRGLIIATAT